MPIAIPPALLASVVLGLFYGSLFHIVQGGTWRSFGSALLTAVIGFMLGQTLGALSRWPLPILGQVHLIEGTVAAWLALAIAKRPKIW